MAAPIDPATVMLSSNISVADYRKLERKKDKGAIANFLKQRFTERYLAPVLDVDTDKKSGFTMMAVACLMIEALESFRQGWLDTRRRSQNAFCSFFAHWPEFDVFRPHAKDFYKHVRCGILHQAETKAWLIRRKGDLWDGNYKIINATKFLKQLRIVLDSYCDQLASEPWESDVWRCCRAKMDSVCKNVVG